MKDPAKAGNFWGQRVSEMPSHNAVRGFQDFRVFPLMAKRNGVERKKEGRLAGRMGGKRDLYFFEGGVLVRTKLSKSNQVVWRSEFPGIISKAATVMLAVVLMTSDLGTMEAPGTNGSWG